MYIKFLKKKSTENEQPTRTINIFWKNHIKKLSKSIYTSGLSKWYDTHLTNNERNHGKCKVNPSRFPKSINANGKSIKRIIALRGI